MLLYQKALMFLIHVKEAFVLPLWQIEEGKADMIENQLLSEDEINDGACYIKQPEI